MNLVTLLAFNAATLRAALLLWVKYAPLVCPADRCDSIIFNSDESMMVHSRAMLDRPLPSSDPYPGELLRTHADTALSRIQATETFQGQVRALLIRFLPRGPISLEAVARELLIEPRTLHRRLQVRELLTEICWMIIARTWPCSTSSKRSG